MHETLIRFLVGGAVVTIFAVIGDILRPKSFAGLFGAAPSVALATLGLTIGKDGASYAAVESRSMIVGAIAFFGYASLVSWMLMHHKSKTTAVTICFIPVWLAVAFTGWFFCLR